MEITADQFTDLELGTLRGLMDRYFDIKEYGWHVWGRRFYERLYLIRAKIDDALTNITGFGSKDEFTYVDLKILLNMVQSEGLRWAKDEAPTNWNFRVSNVLVTSENTRGLMMAIIMVKLQKRIDRQM
ncbi:MAG TPA: hypothetical protein VGQ13_02950 [Nitrososphaera sp.]|jgi:hypothetical protein|nr:hypothetical protein [Nitrososphaera sp.]